MSKATIYFTTAEVVDYDWCTIKVMSVIVLSCESDVTLIKIFHLVKNVVSVALLAHM